MALQNICVEKPIKRLEIQAVSTLSEVFEILAWMLLFSGFPLEGRWNKNKYISERSSHHLLQTLLHCRFKCRIIGKLLIQL
jgi:hypothetical protein